MSAGVPTKLAVPPTAPEDLNLSSQERAYAYWRGCGLSPSQSFRRAGFNGTSSLTRNKILTLEATPAIKHAIHRIIEENRIRYEIDRDKVVEGLLEAINVAKEQSDATAMINGWKELSKVTGVGAPERKEILLHQSNPTSEALRLAPDTELLKLIGKGRTLSLDSPDIVDVEFESNA